MSILPIALTQPTQVDVSGAATVPPVVLALADGRYVVIWRKLDAGWGDLVARFHGADGVAQSGEVQLSFGNGAEGSVSAVALADGGFSLVWTNLDRGGLSPTSEGAFQRSYDAAGLATTPLSWVPADNTDAQHDPDVAVTGGGALMRVWREVDEATSAHSLRVRLDGQPEIVLPPVDGALGLLGPRLVARDDGGVQLVWSQFNGGYSYQVWTRALDATGAPVGDAVRLDLSPGSNATNVDAVRLEDGRLLVSWTKIDGLSGLMVQQARILSAEGDATGAEILLTDRALNVGAGVRPAVIAATADGGFAAAWASTEADGTETDIVLRRFDADGRAAGGSAVVSAVANDRADWTPDVAGLANGSVVVTWTDSTDSPPQILSRVYAPQWIGTGAADQLAGTAARDFLYGQEGNDLLAGQDGNDKLFGGLGRDSLQGSAGSDLLRGELGDDQLSGEAGSDLLFGGAGNDKLYGGRGADRLSGGPGADVLHGGDHADVFVFAAPGDLGTGAQADRILDFARGTDLIDLRGSRATTLISGPFTGQAGAFKLVVNGDHGFLRIDADGDKVMDGEIVLLWVNAVSAADFILS